MNIDNNTPPILLWQDNNNIYIKPMYIDNKYSGLTTFIALEIESSKHLKRFMPENSSSHSNGKRGPFYSLVPSPKGKWVCCNFTHSNYSNHNWCICNYTFGTVYTIPKTRLSNTRRILNLRRWIYTIAHGQQRQATPVIVRVRAVYRYVKRSDNTTYCAVNSWYDGAQKDRAQYGVHDLDQCSNIIEIKYSV